MQLVLNQLVSAYEADPGGQETVEALARTFSLDVDIVKAVLQVHSAIYRIRQEDLKGDGGVNNNPYNEHPAEDVPDEVYKMLVQTVTEIALNSSDDRLRLRASTRLIDEKKGRLDRRDFNNASTSITVINNHFEQIKQERALRKQLKNGKPLTITQPGEVTVVTSPPA